MADDKKTQNDMAETDKTPKNESITKGEKGGKAQSEDNEMSDTSEWKDMDDD